MNRGKLGIYFQSLDNATPSVELGDLKLTFFIELRNAIEFLNFTDLNTTTTFTGKKKLFFQNDPIGTSAINHSLLDHLKSPIFTYRIPLTTSDPENEKVNLVMRHKASGETVSIDDIPAGNTGVFETGVDLSKAKQGLYSFESTNTTTNGSETEQVYIDEALSRVPLFGLVEITYNNDSLSNYELTFQRKTSLWNYILVNKSDRTDFADLLVKDNSSGNESPYQTYQFQKQPGEIQVGGYTAVVFQSDPLERIPFFEKPKLEIELVKELNGSDMVLLKNLSNPSLDQISSDPNESDIYVFV